MTDDTDIDVPLRRALHASATPPDLDRLVADSTHAGQRIRRRRSVLAAGGAVAAAAVITVGIGHLARTPTETSLDAGFAAGGGLSTVPTSTAPSTFTPSTGAIPVHTPDASTRPMDTTTPAGTASYPFTLDPPSGWTCDEPADDKFTCHQADTDNYVGGVVRSADGYADWTGGDADKVAAWVSDVHDGIFVSLEGYHQDHMDGPLVSVAPIANSISWSD